MREGVQQQGLWLSHKSSATKLPTFARSQGEAISRQKAGLGSWVTSRLQNEWVVAPPLVQSPK